MPDHSGFRAELVLEPQAHCSVTPRVKDVVHHLTCVRRIPGQKRVMQQESSKVCLSEHVAQVCPRPLVDGDSECGLHPLLSASLRQFTTILIPSVGWGRY